MMPVGATVVERTSVRARAMSLIVLVLLTAGVVVAESPPVVPYPQSYKQELDVRRIRPKHSPIFLQFKAS
jgi:hypothetical protein